MGFFRNRRNKLIEEQIKEALKDSSEFMDTNIHWEAFVRFAQEHGGRIDKYADGGQDTAFNISLNLLNEGLDENFLVEYGKATKKAESRYRPDHQDAIKKERPWHQILRVSGVRNRLDGTTSIKAREE